MRRAAWLAGALALAGGCKGRGPDDPRPAIAAKHHGAQPAAIAPDEALLAGMNPVACTGFKAALAAAPSDDLWRGLLTTDARAPGCLPEEDAQALAAWLQALPPPDRAPWAGPLAEWLAAHDRFDDMPAPLPDLPPAHRLRVLQRMGAPAAEVLDAAEATLAARPQDREACQVVVRDSVARKSYFEAIEQAGCGGAGGTLLDRERADALAAAGAWREALALYRSLGLDIHAAALLYQEDRSPEALAEARALLAAPAPPSALHRVWLELSSHPDGSGAQAAQAALPQLDASVPALLAKALAAPGTLDAAALTRLANIEDARVALVRARIAANQKDTAGALAALTQALTWDPLAEPIWRAQIALRLQLGVPVGDTLAAWAALDPDAVRLRGAGGDRNVPWLAIAPWSWEGLAAAARDPRAALDAPHGRDPIGDAWRAAIVLPDRTAQLNALEALQLAHPELDALAQHRYRLALGEDP